MRTFASTNLQWVLLIALVVTSGCAAHGLARQEYVLSGVALAESESPTAGRELVVSVGPIEVPAYLRRPQIVTRVDGNRIFASEMNVWAENLGQSVGRAVLANVSQWLPTTRATLFPGMSMDRVDVRVAVRILELAAKSDGSVSLDAFWTLSRAGAGEAFLTRRTTITQPVSGKGYPAIVDAMNAAIGQMSRSIVDALRALPVRADSRD